MQPHHVDLPPVQPIRDRHDPDLAKYLAWGRSLGLIVQNDEGLILEIEGLGSRPLGASEEEALDYLFAHQRYLVAIASRWIAHRVLHDQGDELLRHKLKNSTIEEHVEILARVEGDTERRLIEIYRF